MKDRDVFLIQIGLRSLGFDVGPLDGDLGPKTRAAISAFDASRGVNVPQNVAGRMLSFALSQRHIRETSKNQGPGIAKFWTATTYPDGFKDRQPYCAAFVCWCLQEALVDAPAPPSFVRLQSPVAYDVEAWAKDRKGVLLLDGDADPRPGDIFTLSTASHVGIVTKAGVSTFETVEGNTDLAGDREGDGVYLRSRSRGTIRKLVRLTF